MRVGHKSMEVDHIRSHSLFGFGHGVVVDDWKVAVGIFDDIGSAEVENVWGVK